MSAERALKRRIENFEVSDNLQRFLPPKTEFTIGVQTTWSETPRSGPLKDQEKSGEAEAHSKKLR